MVVKDEEGKDEEGEDGCPIAPSRPTPFITAPYFCNRIIPA